MAKKSARAYFGLGWIVSIILAIIPVTNIVFGIVIRVQRGNLLGVILNIVLFPIFYVIDLITIIAFKNLTILA